MTAPAPDDSSPPLFSRGYRAWLLFMLVLISALNLADRQGLAASSQALKIDLKFSDSQMGLLQGLPFAIFYTLMGLPLARLAEHRSRTRLIAACVGLFGVMATLCSTAQGFGRLVLFRIGVGIGDGGFAPPVGSLIGDHYPMSRRASAMAIIWLGAPLGVVAGSVLGGYLAEHYGWRTTFIVIGLAGVAASLLVLLTLREPTRGAFDPGQTADGPPPSAFAVARFLFAKPAMRQTMIAGALAGISMNAIGQFLNPFLARNFVLGPAEVGRLLGLIAGVSMASGLLLGGFGVDWASRFDRRWSVWAPALGLLLATPLFILGFTRGSLPTTVIILICAHVSMFVYLLTDPGDCAEHGRREHAGLLGLRDVGPGAGAGGHRHRAHRGRFHQRSFCQPGIRRLSWPAVRAGARRTAPCRRWPRPVAMPVPSASGRP